MSGAIVGEILEKNFWWAIKGSCMGILPYSRGLVVDVPEEIEEITIKMRPITDAGEALRGRAFMTGGVFGGRAARRMGLVSEDPQTWTTCLQVIR